MYDVHAALVAGLADADAVVEVGVGQRPDVAAGLAKRGVRVTATDIVDRSVPEEVTFVRDDVTDPDRAVYEGSDVVYALNCPPELQRPVRDVARTVGAEFRFTTLGGDPVVVPARPRTLDSETLFVASVRHDTRNA